MKIQVTNPDPVLEFESNWYIYLKVGGKRVLELANECGTCVFMYSRLQGVEPPIAPHDLAGLLQDGLQVVSQEIIDTVSLLIPSGEYLVGLLNVSPRLARPARSNYWKYLGYGSVRFPYFLGRKYRLDENGFVSQAIVPLFSIDKLDKRACRRYRHRIRSGIVPTAVALSIVEGRHAAAGDAWNAPDEWSIMHFLIDGHHKTFAASQLNKSITLLSFLRYPYISGGGQSWHKHSPSLGEFIARSVYNHT